MKNNKELERSENMKIDKIAILNDISSDNINLISFLDTFAKFSQNTEDNWRIYIFEWKYISKFFQANRLEERRFRRYFRYS